MSKRVTDGPRISVVTRDTSVGVPMLVRRLSLQNVSKHRRSSMRKIVYSSAILVSALLAAIAIGRLPRAAITSPGRTADTIDVQKLGETIDMKAMPQQGIPDEVYH
jgi:hypothetical protein